MEELAELEGESHAIEAVRQQLRRLLAHPKAGQRLPAILIQGETGTGKGLVARLLHRHGPRAHGPFVDLNCAAIPETLLEAELFGFERGAFTDARRAKPGLFHAAHRGTIFLDEVGLLPEALQAKLLKVLEERALRRLGSTTSEPVDVMVISATNADLEREVADRRFRGDLYHRLAVLKLELPPLRERGQDVVLLARRFLARACTEYAMSPKRLTPGAEACLVRHAWPGNVRELANLMERVALLADDDDVSEDLLELQAAPAQRLESTLRPMAPLADALRDHLLTALQETNWNISRTATQLGISRNTVRARIERFGLVSSGSGSRRARRTPKPPVVDLPSSKGSPPPAVMPMPPTIRWDRRRITFLRVLLVTTAPAEVLLDTNRALDMLIQKAGSFGGRVIEIGVTGIIAAFGVEPVEDAPRRAALAAMAMQKAAQRDDDPGVGPRPLKFALHAMQVPIALVGAETSIDEEAKQQIRAVLDGLIAAAGPDGMLISADVAPQLERRFELTPAGSPEGGAHQTYRLGRQEAPGLSRRGRMATFVGRSQEMALLRARLEMALDGRGQLVSILGDAGIGKSRLLFEFRQRVAGESIRYLEGRCSSYGTMTPYLPVLDLVRAGCRITESDSSEVVRDKLRASLEAVGMDSDKHAPYLLHLLGDTAATAQLASISPDTIKLHTFEAVRQLCLGVSQHKALLLLVEDLHWIDRTSEEFFASIMNRLPGSRILFVCTYRPGYEPPWGGRSFATQLSLAPLSDEDSLKVVTSIVPIGSLPKPVTDVILNRAEGNPFFLEELVLAVHDRPDIAADLPLPDTLQGVLVTRFERLPEEEQSLLQLAAVIGRDVPVPTLAALAETGEDTLRPALRHLRAAEFLSELGGLSEVTYGFRHGLTHEVVYESLPPDRRSMLHARVLDVMERLYADRLNEHVDRLASHAVRGGVWTKALTYLRLAGSRALERSATREAALYFDQALTAIQHLPESPELREQAIDLRFDLRNALQPRGELQPMFKHIQEAEALAVALGDQRRLGRVAAYLTDYFRLTGEQDRAIEWGRRALTCANESGDFALKVVANTWLGQVYFAAGDYPRAMDLFRDNVQSLQGELALQRLGMPQPPAIHSRTCLCWCLAELGEFAAGIALGEQAVALAGSADQPLSYTVAYSGLGWLHLRRGEAVLAINALEQSLEAVRAGHTHLWFPRVASALAYAYALAGRPSQAVELAEAAVAGGDSMQLVGGRSLLLAYAGEVYLLAGRRDDARHSAQQALDSAIEHKERGYEGWALRLLAEIALASDPPDVTQATDLARRTLAVAEELNMRPLAARAHLALGSSLAASADANGAKHHLATAAGLLEEMDMQAWLDQARAELERLA